MSSIGPRDASTAAPDIVEIRRPNPQTVPVVLASPHSGRDYPDHFIRQSKLNPLALRRSEDFLVDQIFASGPELGMPIVAARFPRVYCDPNREPYELDPEMFADRLPPYANIRSVRVACGLGTIAKVVSDGAEIYRERLHFSDAEARLQGCYRPYHRALQNLVTETADRFGGVLLLDCHSMPSVGGPMDLDAGLGRKDVVLGDRFGASCHPRLVLIVETILREVGLDVGRNTPYAGGHTTQLYGRPAQGLHALQIEINRGLYMDETAIVPESGFGELKRRIGESLTRIASTIEPEMLRPPFESALAAQ